MTRETAWNQHRLSRGRMTTEVLRALRDDRLGARFPQDDWIDAPARVDGLELLGRLPDSGFEGEQWLAALDGRHFALTPVVYRILECADGRTPVVEVADRVRRSTGKAVSTEDVRWLIEHRLAPAGLVRSPMTSGSVSRSQEPATKGLLRIRARVPLLQPAWIAPLTAILQHAFWQPLVLLLLTAIVVVHLWIYSSGLSTLGEASMLLFHEPRWILLVFAMEIGASLFHELGHAAAMRRSRCPHGPIGLGVYLIWPVFYTDVTPIYRLRRRERLRVDLGGMYFHQIAALGFVGLYAVTGFPLWLLGVIIADVQCLRQFNPFFRFDGYYILADLLGVPDPLSQIGPFLRRLVRRERVPGLQLRRSTEVLFLGYLGLVVVYFVLPYAIGWELGDEIVHTIWITGSGFGEAFGAAWRAADPLLFAAVTIQFFFWLLSVLGLVLFGWTALSLSIGLARRVWAFRGKARTP